jgi:signal peptidase I
MDTPTNFGTASSENPLTSSAESTPRVKEKQSLRAQITQCGIVAVTALASYLFISHFLLQSVQVVGVSMAPTLKNSGYYLLNRCVFLVRNPHPSDIVVIRDPTDQTFAVKRVIAGEGDSVYLKGGHVYVNGHQLWEPYLGGGVPTFTMTKADELSVRCGKGEYFLLGDNRGNSTDSRIYGPVSRQNILGAIIH